MWPQALAPWRKNRRAMRPTLRAPKTLRYRTWRRHLANVDPFALFKQMAATAQADGKPIDASHAFYLGYELAKATTALTLNKDYRQDEALSWGFLTRPETAHRDRPKADDQGDGK
jgi:hypothetical protein